MQKQQVYLRDTSISCPEKYIGLTSKKLQRYVEAISVSCDLGLQRSEVILTTQLVFPRVLAEQSISIPVAKAYHYMINP